MARVTDRIDLFRSRSLDIDACQSVCMALGPYRNLTTLTAATLFLHPNCQVLNHAGDRIYSDPQLNIWPDFSEEKFDRFVKFAITISNKGARGDMGGSIIHSHALDDGHKMKDIYQESDPAERKQQIQCLFWKESLRTSNQIRESGVDLADILNREPRLRFLLPIRNPLDCAQSNLKTGHVRFFKGLDRDASKEEALKAILGEIRWFAEQQKRHADRFFHFFEHSISPTMLRSLSDFLNLTPDQYWLQSAQTVMVTKGGYKHEEKLLDIYRKRVREQFSDFPHIMEGLQRFAS